MNTSRSATKPQDPMLGRVVAGRYRLEARAGEGGMGVVYRARHVLIDRVVALKLIRPDLRGETHLRAWMLREARAANRVDHAHIIDIHDIGETEEGELYLVMEYLGGTSLSSELAKGPMALARAVDILVSPRRVHRGELRMGIPVPEVHEAYTPQQIKELGVVQATELRVPVFKLAF